MSLDLTEALVLHQQGDLRKAGALYEAILNQDPDHPDALHLLGLVRLQLGDLDRAETLIQHAIALRPEEANYHANLAEVYNALGKPECVMACYATAIRLDSDRSEFHSNLGVTLLDQGEIDAAIDHFRAALRLNPDLGPVYNNLGNALRLKGDTAAALDHYRVAAQLQPESPEAHSNLGKTLLERGHPHEALRSCSEAVRLRPSFAEGLTNLGNVFQTLGRLTDAEACFREAIRLRPRFSSAHAGLGGVLDELGRFEEAQTTLREVIRLAPRHAGAYSRLATRLRNELPPGDLAAIESLVADPKLPSNERFPLQFGLAHVYDARHEFDRAANLVLEANALQSADFATRGQAYHPSAHHELVNELIDTFTSKFFDRVKGFGLETDVPIFVVGLPRSGTTLLEQVLASHPLIFGAGELRLVRESFEALPRMVGRGESPLKCVNFLTYEIAQQVGLRHLEALRSLNSSAKRIVDKMPENTLYLGWIAVLFPHAKLIHCRRDVRDVALSCFMTQFGQLRWTCDPDHITSRIQESQRLMDHWRSVLPSPTLEVDYESMVSDLEATAKRLVSFCGLEWNPACLDFHKNQRPVQTASALQVRQPVYSSSVGRWRNYERSLPLLFERLKPTTNQRL